MGKKKSKKLSIKKETLRKLDNLTDAQLREAAGGSQIYNVYYAGYNLGGSIYGMGGIQPPPIPSGTVSGGCTLP